MYAGHVHVKMIIINTAETFVIRKGLHFQKIIFMPCLSGHKKIITWLNVFNDPVVNDSITSVIGSSQDFKEVLT